MVLHPAGNYHFHTNFFLFSGLLNCFVYLYNLIEDAIFIFGGYSKEKDVSKKSEGKIHTDMWMLNLRGILPSGSGSSGIGLSRLDVTKATWQKVLLSFL